MAGVLERVVEAHAAVGGVVAGVQQGALGGFAAWLEPKTAPITARVPVSTSVISSI